MLVVAMISLDVHSFLAFSNVTGLLEDTGIGIFGCTVPPQSKETVFGSSGQ